MNQLYSENNEFLEKILRRYFFILECIFLTLDLPKDVPVEIKSQKNFETIIDELNNAYN